MGYRFLLAAAAKHLHLKLPPHWLEDGPQADFAAPNEQSPWKALPFLKEAPAGAYVAVGTERGFIGAANAPRTTRLILIDVDAGAARYNRINAALLKAARDREHYLRLRLHAARTETPLNAEDWTWWRAAMAFKPSWTPWSRIVQRSFAAFHSPTGSFAGMNYLFDDGLFGRLARMARDGKIEIHRADISALGDIPLPKLGVLDVSNIGYPWYMPKRDFTRMLRFFDRHAQPQSLLLTTRLGWLSWEYRARPFLHVREAGFK